MARHGHRHLPGEVQVSESLPGRLGRIGAAEVVGELQSARRGTVDEDSDVGVVLQDRRGPQGTHGPLDEVVDRLGLGPSCRDEDDVACAHDRREPLGQAVVGNLAEVAVEEARVVHAGLLR